MENDNTSLQGAIVWTAPSSAASEGQQTPTANTSLTSQFGTSVDQSQAMLAALFSESTGMIASAPQALASSDSAASGSAQGVGLTSTSSSEPPDGTANHFVAAAGYNFTLQDQSSDDTLDSDADNTGHSALFTLSESEQKDDIDAGLYRNLPVVSVVASDPNASENGPDTGEFTFSRTGDTSAALTAWFMVSGTAVRDQDYIGPGGVLDPTVVTFAAGQSSVKKLITPIPDDNTEQDETAIVTLMAAPGGGYSIETPSATVVIHDGTNVAVPLISVTAIDDDAHEFGPDTGTFAFTRSDDSSDALTVSFTVSGTAQRGDDYTGLGSASDPTTITFAAGQSEVTKVITPVQDAITESDEVAIVTLVAAANGEYHLGAPLTAAVTIHDIDSVGSDLPVITVAATDDDASEDGPDTGTIIFTRTGQTSAPLTVSFTVSGSALAGDDYTGLESLSVTFAVGESEHELVGTPVSDSVAEDDETIVLNLESGPGYSTGTPASATITIVNLVPQVGDDSFNATLDTTLSVPAGVLLNNDHDPEDSPLSAVVATPPAHGTLALRTDGAFVYTPDTGYIGQDNFSYTVNDGFATSSPADVSITVRASNAAPIAVDDTFETGHDLTLNVVAEDGVLSNDSDPDGDQLFASIETQPTHGTLTLSSDGALTYVPWVGFIGQDSFSYRVSDGSVSDVGDVIINVVDTPPTAADDRFSVLHSGTTSIAAAGVLANDSDPEDPINAILESGPNAGTLLLNSDGSFDYTPGEDFTGTDSFTYRAVGGSQQSGVATVTLTTAPVANDDDYQMQHDQVADIAMEDGVLANDSIASGASMSAILETGPSHGTLTLNADGSFQYTPVAAYVGGEVSLTTSARVVKPPTPPPFRSTSRTSHRWLLRSRTKSMPTKATTPQADTDCCRPATTPMAITLTTSLVSDVSHGSLSFLFQGTLGQGDRSHRDTTGPAPTSKRLPSAENIRFDVTGCSIGAV